MLHGFICEAKKNQVVSIYVYKIEAQCLKQQQSSVVHSMMDSTSAGISCHANINKQPNWIYETKMVPEHLWQ